MGAIVRHHDLGAPGHVVGMFAHEIAAFETVAAYEASETRRSQVCVAVVYPLWAVHAGW